jgi:hypothetical protein
MAPHWGIGVLKSLMPPVVQEKNLLPLKRRIFLARGELAFSIDDGVPYVTIKSTHIYVVNIEQWKEVGRAYGEHFSQIKPATTMVEVRRLIAHEILVEIEADALIVSGH